MLKQIRWKDDTVLHVKLRDDLHSLAQMRRNHLVEFFDIVSTDGRWDGVDLNETPLLFTLSVAENRLRAIFEAKVPSTVAQPNARPIQRVMLTFTVAPGNVYGADLVELDADTLSAVGTTVLKAGLTVKDDAALIHGHELNGMVGDVEKLRTRLVRYFDTGVDWDTAKAFLFKDLQPPEVRAVWRARHERAS